MQLPPMQIFISIILKIFEKLTDYPNKEFELI